MPAPDILAADDLPTWLRVAVDAWVDQGPRRSRRQFATRQKLPASLLNNVLHGTRSLPDRWVLPIADGLELDAGETDVLRALAGLDRARGPRALDTARATLVGMQRVLQARRLGSADHAYVANWPNVVIRELSNVQGYRADPAWILARLRPPLSGAEVEDALRVLAASAPAIRDGKATLSTGHHPIAQPAPDWPRQTLGLLTHGSTLPRDERYYDSYVAAVPERLLPALREQVMQFIQQAIATCDEAEGTSERVVLIAAQLLPLDHPPKT